MELYLYFPTCLHGVAREDKFTFLLDHILSPVHTFKCWLYKIHINVIWLSTSRFSCLQFLGPNFSLLFHPPHTFPCASLTSAWNQNLRNGMSVPYRRYGIRWAHKDTVTAYYLHWCQGKKYRESTAFTFHSSCHVLSVHSTSKYVHSVVCPFFLRATPLTRWLTDFEEAKTGEMSCSLIPTIHETSFHGHSMDMYAHGSVCDSASCSSTSSVSVTNYILDRMK